MSRSQVAAVTFGQGVSLNIENHRKSASKPRNYINLDFICIMKNSAIREYKGIE